MANRFRCGLVVGKFAPLHLGHALVIGRAVASSEVVGLISYSKPEFPGCEPMRREAWLAALYPGTRRLIVTDALLRDVGGARFGFGRVPANGDPASVHRRFCGFLCRDVLRLRPDAVFTSEEYGDGFAAELTGFLRATNPSTPDVTHVCVDRARATVPVSSTVIRGDVHAHRRWLPPVVYASFR